MKGPKGLLCRFQEKTQHQESPQAHHQKEIPQTWNSTIFKKLLFYQVQLQLLIL